MQLAQAPPVTPHPEEVRDTRWVSAGELVEMMAQPGLLWSPWFR
jgi:isopentenyldiphosphate isomerase